MNLQAAAASERCLHRKILQVVPDGNMHAAVVTYACRSGVVCML